MSNLAQERRRIGIFTSGRQDWGLLAPVASAMAARNAIELTVYVSGTHLLDSYGRTSREVEAAGFACEMVSMGVTPDWAGGNVFIPERLGRMEAELSDAMDRRGCDVMLLLGDRIETLSAAVTVTARQGLLAHIHGGDRARGDLDDAIRHAITKLSHVHFPATVEAAERIRRMGEPAWRVHMVGSPAIDAVVSGGVVDETAAREAVGLPPDVPYAVVLQHPCGLGETAEAAAAREICQGVADAGLTAVCLAPNGDPGREGIWNALRDFSSVHDWPIVPTVRRTLFLCLIRTAVALVGNSSAGMVESAAADAVVLNIGPRQAGRQRSANVVDLPADRGAVTGCLRRQLSDEAFAESLRRASCVFGDGQTGRRIAEVLSEIDLSNRNRIKLNEY